MTRGELSRKKEKGARLRSYSLKLAVAGSGLIAAAGCVQVSAPTEPIEINLNINIRQEVVVRLQEDVRELIRTDERDF